VKSSASIFESINGKATAQDCRYDRLEVTPAYELDRVFGARDGSQPYSAAGQGS
jgi:hypothetical protein